MKILCDQSHQLNMPLPFQRIIIKTLHPEKASSDLHYSSKTKTPFETSITTFYFHYSRHISETNSDDLSFSSTQNIENIDSWSSSKTLFQLETLNVIVFFASRIMLLIQFWNFYWANFIQEKILIRKRKIFN